MLALGLAGFGAGSCNSFVDYFRMTRSGDFLNSGNRCAADRALCAGCVSVLSAGCGLFSNINGSMTGRIDFSRLGLIAAITLASALFFALFRAGRRSGYSPFAPVVTKRGYLFHAGEGRATDRAFFAGFMTSLGAGSGLFSNINGSMTGSSDCFGFGFVADRAGVGLDAGILAGRSSRDLALVPAVALGGDHFLCNEYSIADGAVLAFGQSGFGAGGVDCRVDDLGVSRCGNFLHAGESLAADRALRTSFMTSLGAGSGLFRNFNRGMPGCIDRFGLGCLANCAGVGLDTSIFTGRSGRDLALVPAVALCRNNLTVADLLIAVLAVGIAGIAFLGASGGFRVADLGVLM